MKLTILVDNNTYIDQYLLGEPALSFLIEDGEDKILFDTGYSDAFLKNAKAMGIELADITSVAISHGHVDHTGGIPFLAESFDTTKMHYGDIKLMSVLIQQKFLCMRIRRHLKKSRWTAFRQALL